MSWHTWAERWLSGEDQSSKGMCAPHYKRMRRYGDPHRVLSDQERRLRIRNGHLKTGKRQKHIYGHILGQPAHRYAAEQKVGRKLNSSEVVHHIDGDIHNNHPDNLTIMTHTEHRRKHWDWRKMLNLRKRKAGY